LAAARNLISRRPTFPRLPTWSTWRAVFSRDAELPVILPANLPADLHLVENPRDSLEGAMESFKNTEKLPKGPTFGEEAKLFQVCPSKLQTQQGVLKAHR
jgi:hypothetical protein